MLLKKSEKSFYQIHAFGIESLNLYAVIKKKTEKIPIR